MKRAILTGIAAGAVIVGAGVISTHAGSSSLPDVQVPAIQLSNADGTDSTAAWLDLFSQTAGGNPDALGLSDAALVNGQPPLVVIEQQDPTQGLEGLFDSGAVDEVTSVINGPGAASYLTPNG